ncbi:hypothetical protein G7Y89_g3092 [Cudoniella acicularis]|uniref:Uncharacterized protein n=1 Tax=Cudoniella acicularis TaxID=354080 RepID=A0A8H4W809_9HELO|nr:hypothetical protein G7Y89_g3092 [Cudoniella acicularis]
MDLDTDDEVLRTLADGKSMDYEQWPGLLARLIPRLEKIVQEDFPSASPPSQLSVPQIIPSSPPTQSTNTEGSSQDSSESTNKENAPPPAISPPAATLPPQIQTLLSSITSTLETLFSKYPPHTIQRLAELIISPTQYYRTLPSYLHAVDRVVHVTSGAHIFPLPPAIPDPSSAAILSNGTTDPLSISWGNTVSATQSALGSDESLGGALLTPIPWLNKNGNSNGSVHSPMEGEVKTESTEMIEGPNGPGGIETVSVSVNGISSTREAASSATTESNGVAAVLRAEGGVTQGELLRQEQRAGVVPVAQLRGDSDGMGEEDEVPHARGPEEIGMEDMGPQSVASGSERGGPGVSMQGIDIEAAVGRKAEAIENEEVKEEVEAPATPKREAEEEIGGDEKRIKEDVDMEVKEEQDIVLADADGKTEEEPKVGDEGETKGSDIADATAI